MSDNGTSKPEISENNIDSMGRNVNMDKDKIPNNLPIEKVTSVTNPSSLYEEDEDDTEALKLALAMDAQQYADKDANIKTDAHLHTTKIDDTINITTTNISSITPAQKKKKTKNKCNHDKCNKKLGLVPFDCRCGKYFCGQHRHSNDHDCKFDWKSYGKQLLIERNPRIVANKISGIVE